MSHNMPTLDTFLDKEPAPCQTRLLEMYCHFVNVKDLDTLVKLNISAFSGSPFDETDAVFRERNADFIEKNSKSFQFIRNPFTNTDLPWRSLLRGDEVPDDPHRSIRPIIGYTCMLPITKNALSLYKDGRIRDTEFRKDQVASCAEETAAVLAFAIHLKNEYSRDNGAPDRYTRFFLAAIIFHIWQIYRCDIMRKNRPPLLAQTHKAGLARKLTKDHGFHTLGIKTRDKCPLFELRSGN